MHQTPTLDEVLEVHASRRASSSRTALPGVVQSYDPVTGWAAVQPTVSETVDYEDRTAREHLPLLLDVPVIFPGAGPYSITFPIAEGDEVLLIVCSCCISNWLVEGGRVNPMLDQRNHLSDAVAIPGLRSRKGRITPTPPSDAMVLTAAKVKLGSASASQKAVGQNALTTFGTALNAAIVASAGNAPGVAALTALRTALNINALSGTGWSAATSKVEVE